jgi:fumarylacetoacetase
MGKVICSIQSLRLADDIGFGTTISPWIVTLEALQPFRCAVKTKQDPAPFKHLAWTRDQDATVDIKLKISLVRK